MNRSRLACVSLGCILLSAVALLAADRNWQNGTLTGTEQEKVKEGSIETSSTEGSAKGKGNKTEFSKDTTATTTDHYETYQIYTIETDNRVYVVKEHLLFPWSKSANVSVGEPVKFAAEKNKVYILDDDKKEHSDDREGEHEGSAVGGLSRFGVFSGRLQACRMRLPIGEFYTWHPDAQLLQRLIH